MKATLLDPANAGQVGGSHEWAAFLEAECFE